MSVRNTFMKRKSKPTNRIHNPDDLAEIVAVFGCSDRHARRLLTEYGKDYALEMRALQAEKLRLQIQRIQLWLDDLAERYIHVDEYARQKEAVCEAVRTALHSLAQRLLRELPGHTAAEMGTLIEDAVHDARCEMARLADEATEECQQ